MNKRTLSKKGLGTTLILYEIFSSMSPLLLTLLTSNQKHIQKTILMWILFLFSEKRSGHLKGFLSGVIFVFEY